MSEALLLDGDAGKIEAVISYPPGFADGEPISIICHPHPLYSGSMTNKVVYMIADSFEKLGVATLKFNFRGVGKSQGQFDQGQGESDDLKRLANWFRHKHPNSPLWLSGFSFGAYVAARSGDAIAPDRLLLVAPPVSMFDFSSIGPFEVPYMVIQGEQDEVISSEAVGHWVDTQPQSPVYHLMPEADHFFHGRLVELREAILRSWSRK
ncbi:MAG: alpha/beta hydrolase [Gammaproteobacteria bacterium]|nr:alpha/beta hydrolase [Gammaproteobacteria bacterium]